MHNAPSGYWSIAMKAVEPTTSLCVHDASFSAGLLDAAAQAAVDRRAVGLIAYDLPYPEPLNAVRTIVIDVQRRYGAHARAIEGELCSCLAIALTQGNEPTTMADPCLRSNAAQNPSARSLPLLAALARGLETLVILEYLGDNSVTVSIMPLPSAVAAP